MEAKEISKAVIKRLPRYYRYLGELMEENVERISSNDLSKKMHVTASQIRQDLNNFGGFGQQGYGYNVRYLYTEIGKILGLDTVHPMIILGAGNLGQALANYVDFEKRGFKLVGIFDVNPVLEGIAVRGIEIQMLSDLPLFLKENEAPSISLPISLLIVTFIPHFSSFILKFSTACLVERTKERSLIGFTGIRFTWQFISLILPESSLASSSLSLTPATRLYSNVILRPVSLK